VDTEAIRTPQRTSDLELVKRAQQGESDAFATLFTAHKCKVYSLCLRLTSNTTEAEDLTQDAFLQAFRKLSSFRGDSAFSTWLYRITVNTALMHFRKKECRHVSLDQTIEPDNPGMKREYGRSDARLEGSVDRIAFARALQKLSIGYRTVFLMHEVKGHDHREIAELLRCSTGNSKSQLHKAKRKMRDLLGYTEVQPVIRKG